MLGTEQLITIDSLANSGDGVGRIDGRVVFVPASAPQDHLKIQITQDKKSFLKGKILEILRPGPSRIEAPCIYFDRCGGCDWQHISYEQQLREKQNSLVHALQKIAKLKDFSVDSIIPSPKAFHYRNRIQLHFDKKGFYYQEKQSHKPVYIEKCLIADEKINAELQKAHKKKDLSSKGKVELALIGDHVEWFAVDKWGRSELGFRQVNNEQNEFLIQKVLQTIPEKNIQNVVDLYCGEGNWSRAIHEKFPHIKCFGIESNPNSIKKALKHETVNLKFLLGQVEDVYNELQPGEELVIIDPPRSGCSPEVLQSLCQRKPPWLIYISCHPATLARDLSTLVNNDWTVQNIVPIDMFPQTAHLETWVLLRGDS